MKPIRRILLVLDPSLSHTPALERAQALAHAIGAQLWLGLFDRGPRLGLLGMLDRNEAHKLEELMREQESARLQDLRRGIAASGVVTHLIDDRGPPSAERIIEKVRRYSVDLVIKDVGHESAIRRVVFLPLDWELLRGCPVPVWMAGAAKGSLPKRIVAAVDPVHPEHGAGALNDHILDVAELFRASSAGTVCVFSAFAGLPPALAGLDPNGLSVSFYYEKLYEQLREQHHQSLNELLARRGMPGDATMILHGPPAITILDALEDFRPELLVLGTLRRRGISRLLLGSTVERLIGEAPCDIVSVPVEFTSDRSKEKKPVHADIATAAS